MNKTREKVKEQFFEYVKKLIETDDVTLNIYYKNKPLYFPGIHSPTVTCMGQVVLIETGDSRAKDAVDAVFK